MYQERSGEMVYYAQWFTLPDILKSEQSLPGKWHVLYPTGQSESIEIVDCQGWVRLDQNYHRDLITRLDHALTRQHHLQRYTNCRQLYPHWQNSVKNHLPAPLQIHWHLTLSQIVAQHTSPGSTLLQPFDAATQGYQALILTQNVSMDSIGLEDVRTQVEHWAQTHIAHLLMQLLPTYELLLLKKLKPLQKKTGKTQLADLEAFFQSWQKYLPHLLWLDPQKAKAIYNRFNQALAERESDILLQLQFLAQTPEPEAQATLKAWQDCLGAILTQWQADGYLTLADQWQQTLKLPEIKSPVTPILEELQKGLSKLCSFSKEIKESAFNAVPQEWIQAQKSLLELLTRYAINGQEAAYTQTKRRYIARLRSYQLFLEQLPNQKEAQACVKWCAESLKALQILKSEKSRQSPALTLPYLTQLLQHPSASFTADLLQNMSIELPAWLLAPPCAFETLALQAIEVEQKDAFSSFFQAVKQEKHFHLHLLIPESQDKQQIYFKVYRDLFEYVQSLLAPAVQMEVYVNTPSSLANFYCPIIQTSRREVYVTEIKSYNFSFYQNQKKSVPLLSSFLTNLLLNLSQVEAHTRSEEQLIRKQYNALATKPLIEEHQESNLDFINVTLALRQKGLRAVRALWTQQQSQFMTAIHMLLGLALNKPELLEASHILSPMTANKVQVELLPIPDEAEQGKVVEKLQNPEIKEEKEEKSEAQAKPLVIRLYRRLPRFVKAFYIQLLKKQQIYRSLISNDLYHYLLEQLYWEADATGWCYEQVRLAKKWQKTIQFMCGPDNQQSSQNLDSSKYPDVTLSFIHDGEVVHRTLQLEIVKQLITEQGQWLEKSKKIGGRHIVLRVVIVVKRKREKAVWFKLNPEQPGTEYLVQQIDQRLGGFATPAQQLCKIQIGTGQALPVLVTEEVLPPKDNPEQSNNLAAILSHHPEKLEKLSPLSFVSTLLRVLVIHPEDDKSNDYFLLRDYQGGSEYGDRLVRIDNERAFFEPDTALDKRSVGQELNVKTIIFCLDQMLIPWDELAAKDSRLNDYRAHILQLQPAELFQDLLQHLSDLHDQWCQLFSLQEVTQIAKGGLQKGDIIFPIMLILPDLEKALLERLYLIQQAWQGGSMQGMSLLTSVEPRLAAYYQPLFESNDTPAKRFQAGPGKLYVQDQSGQLCTSVSSITSLSRQLNLADLLKLDKDPKRQNVFLQDILQAVWLRQKYSVAQALYGVGIWQQNLILSIEANLRITEGAQVKSSKETRFIPRLNKAQVPVEQHQANKGEAQALRDTAQLQFKQLPMADRTALLKRVSQKLITLYAENQNAYKLVGQELLTLLTQTPFERLSLTSFGGLLDDGKLKSILVCSGTQLLSLDISGCALLTPGVLTLISKHCPNLRSLKARNLTWNKVVIEHMPLLVRLNLSRSAHLKSLRLNNLPQLQKLFVRQCGSIKLLGNVSIWRTPKPIKLPKLIYLDIRQCNKLKNIHVEVERFDNLKCQWEGVSPDCLIDWLQFIYQSNNGKDLRLFAQFRQSITGIDKVLDLSDMLEVCLGITDLNFRLRHAHPFSNSKRSYQDVQKLKLLRQNMVGLILNVRLKQAKV